MALFHNQYRVESARLKKWDYSSPGWYFITICVKTRECVLGEINNGGMILSKTGEIVREEWEKSFEIRKELVCDTFVIMPDHIHAVVGIVETNPQTNFEKMPHTVETSGRTSLPTRNPKLIKPKSISSFIAGFKSAATKRINEHRGTPGEPIWQSRFHDRVIRNPIELDDFRKYIRENPANWETEKNLPEYYPT